MGMEQLEPTPLYEDNEACIAMATPHRFPKHLRAVRLAYHKTRELVTEGIVSVEKVSSQEQLADILTKNLAHVRHAELTAQLMS